MLVVMCAVAIVVLATMTIVTARWVSSAPEQLSQGIASPATWNANGEYWTQAGFWSLCNCTSIGSGPACDSRIYKLRAFQAFTALYALCQVLALLAFLACSFVFAHRAVELAVVCFFGFSALAALLSWAMCVALFVDDACGYGSFATSGFTLQWAFALRVVENVGMSGIFAVSLLRFLGLVNQWPSLMLGSSLLLVLGIASTTSHVWFEHPSIDFLGGGAVQVGPFAECSCITSAKACPMLENHFIAAQAISVFHLLCVVVQCLFVCFVPEVLRAVPHVAVLGVAFLSWVMGITKWGLAIGLFTTCKCHSLLFARFSWPVGVAITEFVLQCAVLTIVAYAYAKQRLLGWYAASSHRFYFDENDVPITAPESAVVTDLKGDDAPLGTDPASKQEHVSIPAAPSQQNTDSDFLAPRKSVSRSDLHAFQSAHPY
jgi:hypothetical protein